MPAANSADVLDLLDCSVVEVAAQLAHVWDDFLTVEIPIEEDADGIWHALMRSTPCRPPQRVVLASLRDLLDSGRRCPTCCAPPLTSLQPFDQMIAVRTLSLRLAVTPQPLAPEARAQAMVRVLWEGPFRFCPQPVFDRLRREILLPGVFDIGRELRGAYAPVTGPLVAFTLGDMRLGRDEDAHGFELFARAASPSLVHAAQGGGVWLLHAPQHYVPALERVPRGLGTVLAEQCCRAEIDAHACEVFGVLCDDAVAGSGDWADIHEWWSAAQLLSGQRSQ